MTTAGGGAKEGEHHFCTCTTSQQRSSGASSLSQPLGLAPLHPFYQDQPYYVAQTRELKNREAELSRRDTFYKEQQERIQEKNAELYKLSSQQFHEAASKAESTIKPRRVEPVCSGLQAQILRCYRDHLHEVLLCSDLAKAYQHCVSTARKG
ncbi:MICOS complex subunit Mic25 isoform X3 [Rattus norvegicus]|uniref:MICOS complex subunit Mic25 isoform X3 n=1 Tax=Rattus norvegicus TaxID=10116 RepID=UPI0019171D07|nr:MICOS complex subunit Mic25 isoform X2 [Rattus norvegicus]